jgi:serine/threonine-protein kinase
VTDLRRRADPPPRGHRSGGARISTALAAVLLFLRPASASALGLERTGELVATGGETALLAPSALWYDGLRDVVVVACPTAHRVLLLDPHGRVQKELGKEAQLRFPRAVAATREGTLYVASSESESLAVFDRYADAVGEHARSLDLSPHRGSKAVRPTALFADDAGRVYVADRANRQVLVLDAEGKLERRLRDVGDPADVWADRGGNVYVAEPAFGGVRVHDTRGRLLRVLGSSPGQFREPVRPRALAVDRVGRVWILEDASRSIAALDAAGNLLLRVPATGLFAPVDLAIDPRDTLYVLDEGANRIVAFRISER